MDDLPHITDGRTLRRDRNRAAVLDAVLDLFAGGNITPGVHEVAERSGVSLRSVYRYFSDTDELLRSAIARQVERVASLYHVHEIGEGPLTDRIETIVTARLRLHAAAAPMMRAVARLVHEQPLLREGVADRRRTLHDQVALHFAPELGVMAPDTAAARLAAVDVLLALEGIEALLADPDIGVDEARRILVDAVTALVGG